jgi:hypothetical protein
LELKAFISGEVSKASNAWAMALKPSVGLAHADSPNQARSASPEGPAQTRRTSSA